MLGLFWDLAEQYDVHQSARTSDFSEGGALHARHAERKVDELEIQVDKLTLTCAALWTLLKRQGFTDDDLETAIRDADLSDGRLDGKIRTKPANCETCGRLVSRRHGRCLFCGA